MEQSSESQSLQAFDLLRQAAKEYNNAEYKFYTSGFFKYVREGSTFLIEDIYIEPDFRGTPVSKYIMENFEQFMRDEGIISYYGRVFLSSKSFDKRIDTFTKWGMIPSFSNTYFVSVSKLVEY